MIDSLTDKEKSELLTAVINHSDDAIYAVSLDGIILTWNKGAEALYGFTAEESIGRHINIFVPEERRHEPINTLQEVARGEHKHHLHTVRQHKDGHKITVSMTICPIKNNAGEVTAISATVRGLTAQEMAETKFKSLLESTPEALIIVDNEGKVAVVNTKTEVLFGYKREEILNKDVNVLISKKFIDINNINNQGYLESFETSNFGTDGSIFATHKNGSKFPVEIVLSPLETNEGWLIIATIRDMTDRKEIEDEIRDLNKKLVTSAKEAGMAEVASGIIHSIGNVLNSMSVSNDFLYKNYKSLSFESLFDVLELLKEHSKDLTTYLNEDPKGKLIPDFLLSIYEPLKKDYSTTYQEIINLNEGVKNICEIVAAQQSLTKIVGVTEKVKLQKIVELTLRIFTSQFELHKIIVEAEYEDIPFIYVDKSMLSQILLNLIQNATDALVYSSDASKEKKINISVKRSAADDNLALIVIRDNGTGIGKVQLDNIFTYGYTTKVNGHGIGLYSCVIYANEIGGKIKVQSDGLGSGASFTLELPLS